MRFSLKRLLTCLTVVAIMFGAVGSVARYYPFEGKRRAMIGANTFSQRVIDTWGYREEVVGGHWCVVSEQLPLVFHTDPATHDVVDFHGFAFQRIDGRWVFENDK